MKAAEPIELSQLDAVTEGAASLSPEGGPSQQFAIDELRDRVIEPTRQ